MGTTGRISWLPLFLLLLGSGCHMLHAQEVAPYPRGSAGGPQQQQQVVLEGNRLVLTCVAGGSWPLQYRWTLNGTYISPWSPQYMLTIPALSRTDAGLYQCVVRNRMGALIQRKVEVQVAYMADYSEAEQRRSVSAGRAAVLSPPPISAFPRLVVTWYRDGHKITPGSRV
ncbi:protein sidekick-1-like [Aplochiton taeniatus]